MDFTHLLKSNAFTEDQKKEIAADLQYLEKNAAKSQLLSYLKEITPHLITIAGTTAIAGTAGYLTARKRMQSHQQGINSSYGNLSQSIPEYQNSPEEFHERFSELAAISPTVASNPQLAHKVIKPRLDKGFDLDDVHRLTAIEYHSARTPHVESPGAVAKLRAISGLENAVQLFGPALAMRAMAPSMVAALQPIRRRQPVVPQPTPEESDALSQMAAIRARMAAREAKMTPEQKEMRDKIFSGLGGGGANLEKKSFATPVSEECLGKMLADAHSMCKTAGIGNWLGVSAKNTANYVQMMAVPLALGVGVGLMKKVMETRETSQMARQADQVYANLRKKNELIRENPGIANEAFDSLRSFAPVLATKPMVAETFLQHVIDNGGRMDPAQIQQLANTQKALTDLNAASGGSFIAGLKEPMSLFNFSVGSPKDADSLEKHKHTQQIGKLLNKATSLMAIRRREKKE